MKLHILSSLNTESRSYCDDWARFSRADDQWGSWNCFVFCDDEWPMSSSEDETASEIEDER
jgi:hypothetical protein